MINSGENTGDTKDRIFLGFLGPEWVLQWICPLNLQNKIKQERESDISKICGWVS